jgi:pimeloyl-ACP methyl ester carboxylesterase
MSIASIYVSDQAIPIMHRLFPCHRLVRIPNAGHWVHSQCPQDFMNIVLPELDMI